MNNEIKFHAEYVEAESMEYTPDYEVVGIYFGKGDPEAGGEHWNFTQSIGDDEDEGVCTVKEVQRIVYYGGIEKFTISQNQLVCVFNNEASKETKVEKLIINYDLNPNKWKTLSKMARRVFKGESYFEIT